MALITWFKDVSINDIALVGGKNASLGEMMRHINNDNVTIPNGFALTTKAYQRFLQQNNIDNKINEILANIDVNNLSLLSEKSNTIKSLIKSGSFDDELISLLSEFYNTLTKDNPHSRVAVRSSASFEDLPNASFAGQQESFLHVETLAQVIERIKDVYASLFGERAIAYRAHHHFTQDQVLMSVGIQEMILSDNGSAGVMFSIDTESGFKDIILINASYGLGEGVVLGAINPDEFIVYKPSISAKKLAILNKKCALKTKKFIYAPKEKKKVKEVDVDKHLQDKYSLNDDDIAYLAKAALVIENHYQRPMDIEWAKDGVSGLIYILQARPETVHSNQTQQYIYSLISEGEVICEGQAVGKSIGQGKARVLKSIHEGYDFNQGDVLVTDMTDPNWEPLMQKASAVVTNRGGRTCHAAIIARELGIAAIVGCHDATKKINNHSDITVSCIHGDIGKVFKGLLHIKKEPQIISKTKPPIPLMLIAAHPSKAFSYHNLPHQGIGLARLEFIIANSIGIHPNALLNLNEMPLDLKETITHKIRHFPSPEAFYIDTLALGIASLAAIAMPYPIIVRLSDFKTNEYEELLGGYLFEKKENNPMLGFRGAARYISPLFKDAFILECKALLKARNDLGMKNIQIMVPFIRTIREAEAIITLLAKHGLKRGEDGLKIIMMCEVPSNVILAHDFLAFFDGFSIGSNDLTQLTLGVDRDSHLLAKHFSEKDPAVMKMLSMAIAACKSLNKYVGICGQGPSDDLSLARWLIKEGIDSIALTPDTINDVALKLSKL